MLPIRTKSIFKSRWIALLWAAGILWTAADFASSQPGGAAGNGADAAGQANDMAAAANLLSGV
jgi:hypothetical protein